MATDNPLIEIPNQPSVPEADPTTKDESFLSNDLPSLELMERQASLRRKEYELSVEKVMLVERKRYAARLFWMSWVWLTVIATFLTLAGFGKLRMADSVLIALITTTTANVLGLFYIVARWLFPNKNSDDNNKP